MNEKHQSYYRELGVQPEATPEQIREAYRKLAKKYHPDRNSGDARAEAKFKRISEAYRVLSDPANRIVVHARETVQREAKNAHKKKGSASFSEMFKRVFQEGFGAQASPADPSQHATRGKDLKITLEVDSIELAAGVQRTLKVQKEVVCEVCGGSGVKPGHGLNECQVCQGLGEVPKSRGGKTIFVTCTNCNGTGEIIKERCLNCGGKSVVKASRKITLDIPAGSKAGQILTIRGQGNAGRYKGEPGDLRVELLALHNEYFDQDGANLTYEHPMSLLELIEGGTVEVPTPTGKVQLTLKPGLENGAVLRVKGKGLPRDGGGYGDLLVRVRFQLPDKLNAKSKKLLDELLRQPGFKREVDKKGFVRKKQ